MSVCTGDKGPNGDKGLEGDKGEDGKYYSLSHCTIKYLQNFRYKIRHPLTTRTVPGV